MEKVNLTISSLQDLYKRNLVILHDQKEKIKENRTENVSVSYTGGYHRKILWLHTEAQHPNLSEENHEMVSKILEACRLSWDDIALVNMYNSTHTANQIIEALGPLFVISSVPSTLYDRADSALYQLTESAGIQITFTDILPQLRNDKNLKVKFWQILKIMFQL